MPRVAVPTARAVLATAAAALAANSLLAAIAPNAARSATPVSRFSHVVEVMLENQSATSTFEDPAGAPHLAQLRTTGVYLPKFFGAGHASLDNYEAAFGAVEPTAQGKADCLGQPFATCMFPASVPTLGALLDGAGLPWRIYSEGMVGAPGGHDCLHAPDRNAPDPYQGPGTNGYATRHNPAPWFASVLDHGGSEAYCQAHNVDLSRFWTNAASPSTLPAWSFIEPDTCHDGHDTSAMGGCAADPEGSGYPSGVSAIEAWLPGFVTRLLSSPGWDTQSLLVITFDEGGATDTSGCSSCHDTSAGGRIGALLIGGVVSAPGTVYTGWEGDHYSLLRTWETAWGLPTLKSKAISPAAAAMIHDGDAGVLPLTGVWRRPSPSSSTTPSQGPAASTKCTVGPLRILLRGRHQRSKGRGDPVTRAVGSIDGHRVLNVHGRDLHSLTLRDPPQRSFTLRLRLRRRRGERVSRRLSYHLISPAGGCPLLRLGRIRPGRLPVRR